MTSSVPKTPFSFEQQNSMTFDILLRNLPLKSSSIFSKSLSIFSKSLSIFSKSLSIFSEAFSIFLLGILKNMEI
uniref:Ovule protein n=1 Tax=Romanomermis culicivorax TaxID=13658 RepID=A0A915HK92_ROMCU